MYKMDTQLMSPEDREAEKKELLAELKGMTYKGWIRPFLKAYAQTGIIGLAAKAAKIGRRAPERLRDTNKAFARLMDIAKEDSIDALEAVAKTRAIHGTRKLVLHHGRPVKDPDDETGKKYLYETKQSDALLIFLLKKYRYPDQVSHTHSGPGGGPIHVQHSLKEHEIIGKIQRQIKDGEISETTFELERDDVKIVEGETDDDDDIRAAEMEQEGDDPDE